VHAAASLARHQQWSETGSRRFFRRRDLGAGLRPLEPLVPGREQEGWNRGRVTHGASLAAPERRRQGADLAVAFLVATVRQHHSTPALDRRHRRSSPSPKTPIGTLSGRLWSSGLRSASTAAWSGSRGEAAGSFLLEQVGFFRFACWMPSLGLKRGARTGRSFMHIRRITIAAAFGVGLAALPLSTAKAQYYPPCSPFPLEWPFCVEALSSAPPQ